MLAFELGDSLFGNCNLIIGGLINLLALCQTHRTVVEE